ncbi:MAG: ATP-binding cassette domain-containing protein, partial [Comamonas sp.]
MIDARDVVKRHGSTTVLHGVSLQIPKGRFTAIIGPNGAGKSTLLSLVSRLMPMSGGTVSVDGLDVATTASDALSRVMAILRQDNQSALRLTVRDLVGFGRFPHSKGRLTVEDLRHVEDALDYLQLQPLAERFLDELSGGQRQRAYIAMVLCQDTPYMLLDEPLNNLDMAHAVAMMKLLR